MDDIIVRSRYPRRSVPNRRRRRYAGEERTLAETIAMQAVIAVLILLAAVGVKSVDTPVTNFLTGKLKAVLSENVDMKTVYNDINSTIDMILEGRLMMREKNMFNEEAVPVGAGFNQSGAVELSSKADGAKEVIDGNNHTAEEKPIDKLKLIAPLEGILSSPFGERIDPNSQVKKMHKGIDIEAEKGASIKAALPGAVIESGSVPSYGNYIKIKHNNGMTTVYAHCSQLIAQKGQMVEQGEIIARVGDTGVAVGSHLHFEIWKDGEPLNPIDFIDVLSK
jgi:murein DD-endopeptidase MepM/ murein hydrolase activator NlpD